MQAMDQKGIVRVLLAIASVIIILAGMRAASTILVPFFLALFLSIILMPLLAFLIRIKIPKLIALVFIMGGVITLLASLGALLGLAINEFTTNLPQYETGLRSRLTGALAWLQSHGVSLFNEAFMDAIDIKTIFGYLTVVVKSVGSLLTYGFLVMLMTGFMLMEGVDFREKMRRIVTSEKNLLDILGKINHYMALKALISLVTAICIYIALKLLEIDLPLLWAVLAFLLNFVPNIGSVIASLPAALMAVIQYDFTTALMVLIAYLVVNITLGSIMEPKILGDGLDLSPLVVLLSLVFWGWILGPVGMLLSVPLTMIAKIILASSPQTRWMAILIGGHRNRM